MKTLAILAVTSLALVGCDRQNDTMNESAGAAKDQIEQASEAQKEALTQQKKEIEQEADRAQRQVAAEAKAEKQRIESQADARQAQIEAQKKQIEAQADAAKADAEAQAKQAAAYNNAERASVDAKLDVNEPAGASISAKIETDTDRDLSTQIKESLTSQNANFANSGVTVMAADGKITLRGTVNSQAEKDALEAQAKAVSGVKSIDNQIVVKTK